MDTINTSLFLFINGFAGHSNVVDSIFVGLSEYTPYAFVGVMVLLWLHADGKRNQASFHAGLAVLLGMLISYIIGHFYFHARPFMDGLGTQLVAHAADTSFPSDHTTFIFAIAFTLWFHRATRRLGAVMVAISTISGLARVYTGVHYPFDIAGAFGVALLSALIVSLLKERTAWLMRPAEKVTLAIRRKLT